VKVTRCHICGGPTNELDRGLCDRCTESLFEGPGANYPHPVYTLRVAFFSRMVVTCFGVEGLLETIPRLKPDLYTVYLHGTGFDVATAAVHESGTWTLNFGDGREYAGRVGEDPFIV